MVRLKTSTLVIIHVVGLVVLVFYIYELIQACVAVAKAAALQAAAWSSNSQVSGGDPTTAGAAAALWPAGPIAVRMLGTQSATQGPVEQAVAAAQTFNYPGGNFVPIPTGSSYDGIPTLSPATSSEKTTSGKIVAGAETFIAIVA
jgi:hypothetical protein